MTSSALSQPARAAYEAFDTNVVVRLVVRDDADQCLRAEATWRRALTHGGAWLSSVVLVELTWVLRVAYRFDRPTTAAAVRRLVDTEGVVIEDPDVTDRALDAFEAGQADFADYMILRAAACANASPLWTFDEQLAGVPGAQIVPT
jgi:predicted nucleic-acid-binding protein